MGSMWRGLGLLFRASPVALPVMLVIDVIQGLAPSAVFAATAVLIDRAPHIAASGDARGAVTLTLGVIAAVLVVERTTQASSQMLWNLVQFQTEAAVDQVRMRAAGALPGLAHFDTPALADSLETAGWAVSVAQLGNTVAYLVQLGASIVGAGIVGSRIAWWAPLVLIGASVPFMVLSWYRSSWLGRVRLGQLGKQRTGGYYAALALGAPAAREVRLFGLERWIVERQNAHWTQATKPLFATERTVLLRNIIFVIPRTAVSSIPFWVAVHELLARELSAGVFAAAVLALVYLGSQLPGLEQEIAFLRDGTRFLPNLWQLADLPETDPGLRPAGTRPTPRRLASGIRFEGVGFAYPGAERPVLDNLDLFVPAGSKLALVGENGAGKSTVVKLLCRMYDPQRGRITLDGIDLREFDLDELRRHLAVFVQDLTQFPLTIAENVGVGAVERVDDTELILAAAAATGAESVAHGLGRGWDTMLAQEFGGVELSGGEWQRVALARTVMTRLARDAPILVLDEPAATLDVRLEHELHQRLETVSGTATTFLISHRLSTVRMCDSIAVLEGGRVVEAGTHAQLLRAGGVYQRLYRLQASRFASEVGRE